MLNLLRKIIKPDNPIRLLWYKAKAMAAAIKYRFPAKKMVIIGVTGTNGKTSTCHIIEHVLRSAGKKVAMISSSELRLDGKVKKNQTKLTSLSPFTTQKFLKRCLQHKVDYVVIEASSHALHQSRFWGIPFAISVLTNITGHEHLDYHETMEKYKEAKKILFKLVEKTCKQSPEGALSGVERRLRGRQIPHQNAWILNTSDQFFDEFSKISCPLQIAYGFDEGNLRASNLTYSKFGTKFALEYADETVGIELKVPGGFNVENALAAFGAALACKCSLEDIKNGLNTFKGIGGRMERIPSPAGFEVIVDFALTPDAIEKLYEAIQKMKANRILGVIGAAGDHVKEKRPIIGEIVARNCDICVVTDDEPYGEDPRQVMDMILEGAKKVKKMDEGLHLIEDRYEAIEFVIKNASEGDIVVVSGMGNLPNRMMNDGPMLWNEIEVVKEIIGKYS